MKKIILLIGLFLSPMVFSQTNKALFLVDNMQKKYKSLAGFTANFSLDLGDGQASTGMISVMGTKFKLKLGGQEIYNNGAVVSTYFKELNEVTIAAYDPQEDELSPAKIYNFNKSAFKINFLKEDASTAQVELIPKKSPSIAKIALTIDKTTKLLKSWVIQEKSGGKQVFKVTKMNTQVKLPNSTFEFNRKNYPGVEINDLR